MCVVQCSSQKNNASKQIGFLNRKVQSTRTVLLFLFRLLDLFVSGVPTNSFYLVERTDGYQTPSGQNQTNKIGEPKKTCCVFFGGSGYPKIGDSPSLRKEVNTSHLQTECKPASAQSEKLVPTADAKASKDWEAMDNECKISRLENDEPFGEYLSR